MTSPLRSGPAWSGEAGDTGTYGHLSLQSRAGLLELAVLDLQDVNDPGQELSLDGQIVAFGAVAGQVLLLGRAGPRGVT
jgi:hypothetical protein